MTATWLDVYKRQGLGNDHLTGGSGNDRLIGYSDWSDNTEPGNDTFDGGAGSDEVFGGDGSDTYFYGRGDGSDVIGESQTPLASDNDVLQFKPGVLASDVSLYKVGRSLVAVLENGGAQVEMPLYFDSGSGSSIEQIKFDDGAIWSAADIAARVSVGVQSSATGTGADDVFVVDDEYDTITEIAGGGTDTVNASRSYTLPANVENLNLTETLNINATGNNLNNVLRGNDGNNSFNGAGGVGNNRYGKDWGWDTAYGGKGDDWYVNVETIVELRCV